MCGCRIDFIGTKSGGVRVRHVSSSSIQHQPALLYEQNGCDQPSHGKQDTGLSNVSRRRFLPARRSCDTDSIRYNMPKLQYDSNGVKANLQRSHTVYIAIGKAPISCTRGACVLWDFLFRYIVLRNTNFSLPLHCKEKNRSEARERSGAALKNTFLVFFLRAFCASSFGLVK